MGAMIRAGVEPEDAARAAGLTNLEFSGGRPITLRYEDEK